MQERLACQALLKFLLGRRLKDLLEQSLSVPEKHSQDMGGILM
jgi:TnpA family transposase